MTHTKWHTHTHTNTKGRERGPIDKEFKSRHKFKWNRKKKIVWEGGATATTKQMTHFLQTTKRLTTNIQTTKKNDNYYFFYAISTCCKVLVFDFAASAWNSLLADDPLTAPKYFWSFSPAASARIIYERWCGAIWTSSSSSSSSSSFFCTPITTQDYIYILFLYVYTVCWFQKLHITWKNNLPATTFLLFPKFKLAPNYILFFFLTIGITKFRVILVITCRSGLSGGQSRLLSSLGKNR